MHKFMGLKFLAGLGLVAGAGLMVCRMAEMRHELMAEGAHGPQGEGEPHHFGRGHGHWRTGVPPMFEYWHKRAHAQDQAPAPEADKAKPAAEISASLRKHARQNGHPGRALARRATVWPFQEPVGHCARIL